MRNYEVCGDFERVEPGVYVAEYADPRGRAGWEASLLAVAPLRLVHVQTTDGWDVRHVRVGNELLLAFRKRYSIARVGEIIHVYVERDGSRTAPAPLRITVHAEELAGQDAS